MKQIGIIFSEKIFKKVPPYIQVTDDMSLLDSDLPKLIIGLELSKRHIDNFSIIEKKANDNLYWTFKKTEKRNDYEKDLNNFYKEVIKNISSLTEYKYVNVISIDKKRLFNIAKILNDIDKIKVFYFLDNKNTIIPKLETIGQIEKIYNSYFNNSRIKCEHIVKTSLIHTID